MTKIYWYKLSDIVGGPQVRTRRMQEEFGSVEFLKSSVVVGQSWFSPHYLLIHIFLSLFKKTMFIQNGFHSTKSCYGRLKNFLLFLASISSRVVIFQSEYCRERYLELFGRLPSDYHVIHNANPEFQEEFFSDLVDEEFKLDSRYVVLTGNIREKRRRDHLDLFCDVWNKSSYSNVKLVMFEDKNTRLSNGGNIEFLGKVDVRTAVSIVRSSIFVVHLKENDPCPNAVLEALSVGKKVLHHNSGGTKEIVLGDGIGFSKFNRAEIELAINNMSHLLSSNNDNRFNARDKWNQFCESYRKIFDGL